MIAMDEARGIMGAMRNHPSEEDLYYLDWVPPREGTSVVYQGARCPVVASGSDWATAQIGPGSTLHLGPASERMGVWRRCQDESHWAQIAKIALVAGATPCLLLAVPVALAEIALGGGGALAQKIARPFTRACEILWREGR
jgi:hypothetical protein